MKGSDYAANFFRTRALDCQFRFTKNVTYLEKHGGSSAKFRPILTSSQQQPAFTCCCYCWQHSDRNCWCELPEEEKPAYCFTDCWFHDERITSACLDFCNCEINSRLTWYFCTINFIMFPGMKELKDKPNPPFSCVWPPAFGNFMPFP